MEQKPLEIHSAKDLSTPQPRTAEPAPCPLCSGTGWQPCPDQPRTVRQCKCAKERILKARIRTILEDWKEYQEASLENFKPRSAAQERALEVLRDKPHASYFIKGIYKQGKTRLMICQYRRMAEEGIPCVLRTAKDLVDELRKAETPAIEVGSTPFDSPVLKLVNLSPTGHLFIDDIEKAGIRSGFRAESIWNLFDTMKRRKIGLTFTSNMPMKHPSRPCLVSEMTNEVVSRLDQLCPDTIDLG